MVIAQYQIVLRKYSSCNFHITLHTAVWLCLVLYSITVLIEIQILLWSLVCTSTKKKIISLWLIELLVKLKNSFVFVFWTTNSIKSLYHLGYCDFLHHEGNFIMFYLSVHSCNNNILISSYSFNVMRVHPLFSALTHWQFIYTYMNNLQTRS